MTLVSDRGLRVVVMGTGPFAVPLLHALLGSPHEVVAVVTRPVQAAAGRRPPPSPMRDAAAAAGLPVLAPADVNASAAIGSLAALAPDLLVVCDYGQLLSPATLAVAAHGGVNLHGSLLPRHRGAAPVQWAILSGDAVTGVSVIHMTPALDAGNVLVTRETPIAANETAAELEPRLAALGGPAVLEAIRVLVAAGPGSRPGTPQEVALVTRAPRLTKADGLVDWSRPAAEIERRRRALEPWPRTTSFLHAGGGRPAVRIVLEDLAVAPPADGGDAAEPGAILAADDAGLTVACGGGTRLLVRRLVPEGKRSMSAAEFIRGHRIGGDARLGGSA